MPLHRFLPSLLLVSAVHAVGATGIEDMRSNDAIHGLYEIRESAREFVARENGKAGNAWEAGEPNLKVLVPRCAVPLKARWDTIRWSSTGRGGEAVPHERRVISVACMQAVKPSQKWDVHVPVVQRK